MSLNLRNLLSSLNMKTVCFLLYNPLLGGLRAPRTAHTRAAPFSYIESLLNFDAPLFPLPAVDLPGRQGPFFWLK